MLQSRYVISANTGRLCVAFLALLVFFFIVLTSGSSVASALTTLPSTPFECIYVAPSKIYFIDFRRLNREAVAYNGVSITLCSLLTGPSFSLPFSSSNGIHINPDGLFYSFSYGNPYSECNQRDITSATVEVSCAPYLNCPQPSDSTGSKAITICSIKTLPSKCALAVIATSSLCSVQMAEKVNGLTIGSIPNNDDVIGQGVLRDEYRLGVAGAMMVDDRIVRIPVGYKKEIMFYFSLASSTSEWNMIKSGKLQVEIGGAVDGLTCDLSGTAASGIQSGDSNVPLTVMLTCAKDKPSIIGFGIPIIITIPMPPVQAAKFEFIAVCTAIKDDDSAEDAVIRRQQHNILLVAFIAILALSCSFVLGCCALNDSIRSQFFSSVAEVVPASWMDIVPDRIRFGDIHGMGGSRASSGRVQKTVVSMSSRNFNDQTDDSHEQNGLICSYQSQTLQ